MNVNEKGLKLLRKDKQVCDLDTLRRNQMTAVENLSERDLKYITQQ